MRSQINFISIFCVLFLLLSSCIGGGTKIKKKNINDQLTTISSSGCQVGHVEHTDCSNEKVNSTLASRINQCVDLNGTPQLIVGNCFIGQCKTGFFNVNNECQQLSQQICSGNSSRVCSVNHGVGTQSRTCNNGTWFPYGTCQVVSCNNGYIKSGNFCITAACSGASSRNCNITYGTGIQSRTCNNGIWSIYGTCQVVSCNNGYIKSGNFCITVACSGTGSRSCSIGHGIGTQSRTCNNGVWSSYGSCQVVSCNDGYEKSGSLCVQKQCTGLSHQTCVVSNGMGNQTRTCNLGSWSSWGACVAQNCNPGFEVVNGNCERLICIGNSSRTCSITNGSGLQSRECDLGQWSSWSSCIASSCNSGYHLDSEVCVSNTCVGYDTRNCNASHGTGTQNRICNNGTWSSYGTCQLLTCDSGYKLQNNQCMLSGCQGDSAISCTLENGTGSRSRYCNGTEWSDYGDCTVVSCQSGFAIVHNSCRPTSCPGISARSCIAQSSGLGIRFRTCDNGTWSTYGVCGATMCHSNNDLINGVCVERSCTGESISTCSDSSGSGLQQRSCVNNNWSSYGLCKMNQCTFNREVKNNQCVLVACQGESTRSCQLENGTGKQKRFCQNSQWSTWGTCIIDECEGFKNIDYVVDITNNRCICSVYTTQSCNGINGSGMKRRTCSNNKWSEYETCQLYYCNTGYTLNPETNTCVSD